MWVLVMVLSLEILTTAIYKPKGSMTIPTNPPSKREFLSWHTCSWLNLGTKSAVVFHLEGTWSWFRLQQILWTYLQMAAGNSTLAFKTLAMSNAWLSGKIDTWVGGRGVVRASVVSFEKDSRQTCCYIYTYIIYRQHDFQAGKCK